jgi:hypothetical protein
LSEPDQIGSLWRRWDPHIHAPGTALADRFTGPEPWGQYLALVEGSDPPIEALGVTDYLGLDLYEKVKAYKEAGRLPQVGLIFPNIEMRFGIGTPKGSAINVHLLVSPDDPNHVAEARRFLLALEFRVHGDTYRCAREDLIRLGKRHDTLVLDDAAALDVGTTQFKVGFDQLRAAFDANQWATDNILVAVAGGSNDGTSGLQDDAFKALRREIEGYAEIIFSSQPKQRAFWLGRGAASVDQLKAGWGGAKACLHGSDAHDFEAIGTPQLERFCWLKGDLTFETLRQACIEPDGRTHIGPRPPGGALPSQVISRAAVDGAAWLPGGEVTLNPGLVAIIGARGSGKTALADLVAAGANAHSRSDKRSFLLRAKPLLKNEEVTVAWSDGRTTTKPLREDDFDVFHEIEPAEVRYLSQQFVDQLCSAEGVTDELLAEIKRVIFLAHDREARLGTRDFNELLDLRAGRARDNREREQQAFKESSDDLEAERIRKSALLGLQKQRQDKAEAIAADKRDRVALMGKGSAGSAPRLDAVTNALDAARGRLDVASRRVQSLSRLKDTVANVRTNVAPNHHRNLQQNFAEAGLSATQWSAFQLAFVGQVDTILASAETEARGQVASIRGPEVAKVVPEALASSSSFFADSADLTTLSVNLLDAEASRLQGMSGIDAENSRKLAKLAEKITQSEVELAKIDGDIALAQQADTRIVALLTQRGEIYERIFAALIEEEDQLSSLYAPLKERLTGQAGSLGKLSFTVRRSVDLDGWAKAGEALLDLRKTGPFRLQGTLAAAAKATLVPAWESGTAAEVAAAMREFRRINEAGLVQHRPEDVSDADRRRAWGKQVSEWLYATSHVTVAYGIQYDGAEIEQLSPGTRGIVLLLLYLAIDLDDDRPLIIDQPEENLDPKSIFVELVDRFREAKARRQIIVVTHNANLVVNTDADQVIVATCGPHKAGRLPEITYRSGGLEDPNIRAAVCDILEGGEAAFQERARRLRVRI